MSAKLWATSPDGRFDFISLTTETLEGGLNVMRNAYFNDETVAIVCEVNNNPKAKAELDELSMRAAHDGVSLVCIDKTNGKVVATMFNKLHVKNSPEDDIFYQTLMNNCKEDESKAYVQFMKDADEFCKLFDYYNVDCFFELMFVATLSEYRKLGLALKLIEISIDLARTLLKGVNVKVPIDEKSLELEPVPKMVFGFGTSFVTQYIAQKLGFQTMTEISYEKFFYKGQSFASKIDHIKFCSVDFLKL